MKEIVRKVLYNRTGCVAIITLGIFFLLGLYAPLFAASKPIVVVYEGDLYFPLFDFLFFSGYYTKKIDLFFNLAMFTFPFFFFRKTRMVALFFQIVLFLLLWVYPSKDPLFNREKEGKRTFSSSWQETALDLSEKEKRSAIFEDMRLQRHHARIMPYLLDNEKNHTPFLASENRAQDHFSDAGMRRNFFDQEEKKVSFILWPFFREFHWEEDSQMGYLSKKVPFWEMARPNQKDLMASLLFGIRIAFVVGIISEAIILLIAIPLACWAGWLGGWVDLIVLRIIEIWESMPLFFMLLFLVSMMETKSIFQVIFAIGFFGWTSSVRYLRAEIFREKGLPYVDAARLFHFSQLYIVRRHILPNAIIPLLALVPFSILQAISSEAGLSFLGLGEENSASWGVIMDEARQFFPGSIDLMWPPALCLTLLLMAIALLGDALRDAIDPRQEN